MMLEEKWLSKKEEQGYQFKRVAEEAKREEEKAEKIKWLIKMRLFGNVRQIDFASYNPCLMKSEKSGSKYVKL